MTCNEFQILMNRDLDGVLDSAGQKHLSAHLAGCPKCSSGQASLQAIRGACRDLRHVDVRPGLAEAIIERATAPRAPLFRIPRFALIPIAASVLGLCLVSGAVGFRLNLQEPSGVQAAPDWKRVEETQTRSFLSGQLGLPEERVDAIIKIRRDFDQKAKAAVADHKEQIDKLQKSELEEIWKILPADAQTRYLDHDRSFTVPR